MENGTMKQNGNQPMEKTKEPDYYHFQFVNFSNLSYLNFDFLCVFGKEPNLKYVN